IVPEGSGAAVVAAGEGEGDAPGDGDGVSVTRRTAALSGSAPAVPPPGWTPNANAIIATTTATGRKTCGFRTWSKSGGSGSRSRVGRGGRPGSRCTSQP